MSLHTWCRQGTCKPSSCATFTLNSHWGRAATGKKLSFIYVCRITSVMSTLCDPVDCGLPGFSVGGREGGSPGKNWNLLASTGCHTFQNTLFPMAVAINSPEYLVLPESL